MNGNNVILINGLRIHTCPKVGLDSIVRAVEHLKPKYVDPEDPGDEPRFMAVRHPLDRIVSCWMYFCRMGQPTRLGAGMGELGYYNMMPFANFLDICLAKHDQNRHTAKQTLHAGPHRIDKLVPLHNLTHAWRWVMDKVPVKGISHTHITHHDPWETYYTGIQRERAESVFQDDIQLYEQSR